MSDELINLKIVLEEVYTKYIGNDYIIGRIKSHITNLENVLENENKKNDDRIIKYNELSLEQENFCKVFLNKHQYYYMMHSSLFYEYDNKHYKIVSEDEIQHTLLSSLTDQPKLSQWKHKTKQMIIKQIKESNLLKSTPESYTIQSVINNFSSIFESKIHTKYFLTIIGDCILKKNYENKYFVNNRLKKLITLIDDICYIISGTKILNNFITKYHENHKLVDYRLIKSIPNFIVNDIITDIVNTFGIDIICVACYYSERYGSSDNYILTVCDDESVQSKILYFKNNPSEEYIFNQFTNEYITQTNNNFDATISWKNLQYLWIHFLNSTELPNVIYSDKLKDLLLKKYKTMNTINEEKIINVDVSNNTIHTNNILFYGITSKYLPSISSFLKFWEKYVYVLDQNTVDNIPTEQYEVDELILLYKSVNKNVSISDKDIINIIKYYFCDTHSYIQVIDNKYIIGIHCSLWNKPQDIKDFLNDYKPIIDASQTIIAFSDLYSSYKIYIKAKTTIEAKHYHIINKNYFEAFICGYLSEYIMYDTFVSCEWFTNNIV
jgi:hypothetical protein